MNYYYQPSYYYLNSSFEEIIDEKPEEESQEDADYAESIITDAVDSAQPSSILTAAKPKLLEQPLFAEFQKLTVIKLNSPQNFDARKFENSLRQTIHKRLSIAAARFSWIAEKNYRKTQVPLLAGRSDTN